MKTAKNDKLHVNLIVTIFDSVYYTDVWTITRNHMLYAYFRFNAYSIISEVRLNCGQHSSGLRVVYIFQYFYSDTKSGSKMLQRTVHVILPYKQFKQFCAIIVCL